MVTYNMDHLHHPHPQRMSRPRRGSSVSSGFRLLDADQLDAMSSVSRNSICKLRIDAMFDDTRISSLLLIVSNHISTSNGFELACGSQFTSETPAQRCTLTNATQYDLDTFGVAGIPEGALLEVHDPKFQMFDEFGFTVLQKAHNLIFSKGIVLDIKFLSSTLESLKVMNSWIVRFEVAEEDNFSLKTLTIRSNKFRHISPTLRYLKSLEELIFQKCSLEFVNFKELAKIEMLRVLDLSWNKIHFIGIDPLMPLIALEFLDVSHNQLKDMAYFPDAFPALRVVSLLWNEWFCDWVSKAREIIWTSGITLMGEEIVCNDHRKGRMADNGGLCCRERPKHYLSAVHGIDILSTMHALQRNSTQPEIVLLDEENNDGKSTIPVYNSN